jgi:hypothetical protein
METKTVRQGVIMSLALMMAAGVSATVVAEVPERNVYFGDTHLHTSFSPDAYFLENKSIDPHLAYRYAKGLPIVHPYNRARIQIKTPLDFLIVSDHAELMGVPYKLFDLDCRLTSSEAGRRYIQMVLDGKNTEIFEEFSGAIGEGQIPQGFEGVDLNGVVMDVWNESIEITDSHNDPGNFTTFIGWEWSSAPQGNNLHRVVFMPDDKTIAEKFQPFAAIQESYDDAAGAKTNPTPEALWNWLENTSKEAPTDFVAIPHNSNISGGLMFDTTKSDGSEFDSAYIATRMKWEPLVEVTQIKGDSETHPCVSEDDPFADFETFEHQLDNPDSSTPKSSTTKDENCDLSRLEERKGSYIRPALMRGLEINNDGVKGNPYKFGLIGSTDSHTGASSAEEDNFWGKTAIDSIPESKWDDISFGIKGADGGASGLAAVWAEENTRESLFAAFKRKEVYATTGTRLQVRFFGGWDFTEADINGDISVPGYEKGQPMGGDIDNIPEATSEPSFIMEAVKDPKGANLDRIQIIKGWVESGTAREHVYDVKLSTVGESELKGLWVDSDFDPLESAFYYVRVLEVPTYRHTTYDLLAMDCIDETGALKEPRSADCPESLEQPIKIQERAYTSPIWYTPASGVSQKNQRKIKWH